MEEAVLLKLNTEMVNLSACQTGLGQDVEGDRLIGLRRALMVSGVRRVE